MYDREYPRNVIHNTTHVMIQIFCSEGPNMYLYTRLKKNRRNPNYTFALKKSALSIKFGNLCELICFHERSPSKAKLTPRPTLHKSYILFRAPYVYY